MNIVFLVNRDLPANLAVYHCLPALSHHKIWLLTSSSVGKTEHPPFALIQLSSIVTDNISMIDLLGLPKEIFMQYMFISLTVLFPIFLIFTLFLALKTKPDSELSLQLPSARRWRHCYIQPQYQRRRSLLLH